MDLPSAVCMLGGQKTQSLNAQAQKQSSALIKQGKDRSKSVRCRGDEIKEKMEATLIEDNSTSKP
jgi:hypothetical protein